MITSELGLPDDVRLCLFDLDGVLTNTAAVHTVAWGEVFDEWLRDHGHDRPFDRGADYTRYVDGKPRAAGVRDFLASRGVELDEAGVTEVGDRKNARLLELIERDGVVVFDRSVTYLRAVRDAGLRTAVVSSSANTEQVLEVTGIADLLELRVDAIVAEEQGLPGKPAPDTFLYAAQQLGGGPDEAVVFEDALSGVEAAAAGGFRYVVGVDRAGQADALRDAGAHRVVRELDELLGGT